MIAALLALACTACGSESRTGGGGPGEPTPGQAVKPAGEPSAPAAEPGAKPGRTLLVTQSRFKANEQGKYVVPDAGVLLLLTPAKGKWKV
jgi:hypothetical protein